MNARRSFTRRLLREVDGLEGLFMLSVFGLLVVQGLVLVVQVWRIW